MITMCFLVVFFMMLMHYCHFSLWYLFHSCSYLFTYPPDTSIPLCNILEENIKLRGSSILFLCVKNACLILFYNLTDFFFCLISTSLSKMRWKFFKVRTYNFWCLFKRTPNYIRFSYCTVDNLIWDHIRVGNLRNTKGPLISVSRPSVVKLWFLLMDGLDCFVSYIGHHLLMLVFSILNQCK